MDDMKVATIAPILMANIDRETRLITDEASHYSGAKNYSDEHGFTRQGQGAHVSKIDRAIHTNIIEGFFSIFKRGMKSVCQHNGHDHLNRYLAKFGFCCNNRVALGVNDIGRADNLLRGVVGNG